MNCTLLFATIEYTPRATPTQEQTIIKYIINSVNTRYVQYTRNMYKWSGLKANWLKHNEVHICITVDSEFTG